MKNEMKATDSNQVRILGREIGRVLDVAECNQVAGGFDDTKTDTGTQCDA